MTAHDEHYAHYLELAERRGLIDPVDTAVIFDDLSVLARQVDGVRFAWKGTIEGCADSESRFQD